MPLTLDVGHVALLISLGGFLYTVLGRKDRQDEQRLREIQVFYGEQIRLLERRLTASEEQHAADMTQMEVIRSQHGECHKQIVVLTAQLAMLQEAAQAGRPRSRT